MWLINQQECLKKNIFFQTNMQSFFTLTGCYFITKSKIDYLLFLYIPAFKNEFKTQLLTCSNLGVIHLFIMIGKLIWILQTKESMI